MSRCIPYQFRRYLEYFLRVVVLCFAVLITVDAVCTHIHVPKELSSIELNAASGDYDGEEEEQDSMLYDRFNSLQLYHHVGWVVSLGCMRTQPMVLTIYTETDSPPPEV